MGNLMPVPVMKFFNAAGVPLAGGQLFSYIAGTTTPQSTYTDSTGSTPNANPQILDSNGQAVVWLGPGAYKFVLEDALNNVLWTVDNVASIPNGSITTAMFAAGAVTSPVIATGAVGSTQIAAGAVGSTQIAVGAVGPTQLAASAVGASQLNPAINLPAVVPSIEIVMSDTGDFGGGRIYGTPQVPWAAPNNISVTGTLPTGSAGGCAWSPGGEYLAVAHQTIPAMTVYQREVTNFYKIPNPAPYPSGTTTGAAWSPDGKTLILSSSVSPYIYGYRRDGSTLTQMGQPATLPPGASNFVAWSRDGEMFAIASTAATYLAIYVIQKYTGTSLMPLALSTSGGNTYTDTAVNTAVNTTVEASASALFQNIQSDNKQLVWLTAPSGAPGVCTGLSWSPDGQFLAVSSLSSPYILVYQRVGRTFTLMTAPSTLPPGSAYAVSWSPDGSLLAVYAPGTPSLTLYSVASGVLTHISSPSTLPSGTVGGGLAWSPNSQYLAVVSNLSPYIIVYQRSGTTLTAMTAPSTLPTGACTGVSWSENGEYIAVSMSVSPYVTIYQTSGSYPTSALLWVRQVNRV